MIYSNFQFCLNKIKSSYSFNNETFYIKIFHLDGLLLLLNRTNSSQMLQNFKI